MSRDLEPPREGKEISGSETLPSQHDPGTGDREPATGENASRAPGPSRAEARPGGCSTKKMLKNNDRTQNVHENKGNMDNMPDAMSDIYVDLTRVLQKNRVCDRQNAQEFSR
jgi:hypothetical protein